MARAKTHLAPESGGKVDKTNSLLQQAAKMVDVGPSATDPKTLLVTFSDPKTAELWASAMAKSGKVNPGTQPPATLGKRLVASANQMAPTWVETASKSIIRKIKCTFERFIPPPPPPPISGVEPQGFGAPAPVSETILQNPPKWCDHIYLKELDMQNIIPEARDQMFKNIMTWADQQDLTISVEYAPCSCPIVDGTKRCHSVYRHTIFDTSKCYPVSIFVTWSH